jgi:hypothetical protein
MAKAARIGTTLTLPLVLLSVSLFENVVTYKLRQHVPDVYGRTALSLVLYGSAFAVAGEWVSPEIKKLLVSAHKTSRVRAGSVGTWLFFGAAYALVYWAYLVVERKGPGALLPAAWR